MKTKIATAALAAAFIWMLLLDLCLTRRFSVPLNSGIGLGLAIQVIVFPVLIAALNARPGWGDYLIKLPSTKLEAIAIIFPIFLVVLSPVMVANEVNFSLYGNDKLIVGHHAWEDLSLCCANPFASPSVPEKDFVAN